MPTGEAVDAVNSFATETPRSEKLGWVRPYGVVICRLGTAPCRSEVSVTPRACRSLPLIAETAAGTSCSRCSRFWAVTTMSSSAGLEGASAAVEPGPTFWTVCASAAAGNTAAGNTESAHEASRRSLIIVVSPGDATGLGPRLTLPRC